MEEPTGLTPVRSTTATEETACEPEKTHEKYEFPFKIFSFALTACNTDILEKK